MYLVVQYLSYVYIIMMLRGTVRYGTRNYERNLDVVIGVVP